MIQYYAILTFIVRMEVLIFLQLTGVGGSVERRIKLLVTYVHTNSDMDHGGLWVNI